MTLKFVDGVEALHNKYLTGCNFSYLQLDRVMGVCITLGVGFFVCLFSFFFFPNQYAKYWLHWCAK